MDAKYKTILAIGPALRRALLDDPEFAALTDRVIPVVSEVDQKLPFVTFFRSSVTEEQVKGTAGPRKAVMQFQVFSSSWSSGLEIAEVIVDRLDGYRDDTVRRCFFTGASEDFDYNVPAYVQVLTFETSI